MSAQSVQDDVVEKLCPLAFPLQTSEKLFALDDKYLKAEEPFGLPAIIASPYKT